MRNFRGGGFHSSPLHHHTRLLWDLVLIYSFEKTCVRNGILQNPSVRTDIQGHNHLMDVVASLSRDSKIGRVRVNHKVSTTGDGTRKQGDVKIFNFPISLWDGLVIDVSFVCEFKGSSRAPGGWNTVCSILMTSYRPVPTSRTTNTRTFMGSSQGVCTCHRRYVWSDPR